MDSFSFIGDPELLHIQNEAVRKQVKGSIYELGPDSTTLFQVDSPKTAKVLIFLLSWKEMRAHPSLSAILKTKNEKQLNRILGEVRWERLERVCYQIKANYLMLNTIIRELDEGVLDRVLGSSSLFLNIEQIGQNKAEERRSVNRQEQRYSAYCKIITYRDRNEHNHLLCIGSEFSPRQRIIPQPVRRGQGFDKRYLWVIVALLLMVIGLNVFSSNNKNDFTLNPSRNYNSDYYRANPSYQSAPKKYKSSSSNRDAYSYQT